MSFRSAIAGLLCALAGLSAGAQDPVMNWIVRADSLAQAAGDAALAAFVRERAALAGAAIGQLVETGLQLGDAGDSENERGNLEFARRVAALHQPEPARQAYRDYLRSVAGWDAAARATRTAALELEAQAKAAQGENQLDRAVELFEQARLLYETIGELRALAVLYGSLGVVHWYRADWPQVEASYLQALERRRALDDRILEGRTLNGLGSLHYTVGDPGSALGWYEQAAALRRSTGDLAGLGTSLGYAANCQVALGRPLQARELFDQALPVLEALGEQRKIVETLDGIANLHEQMGRLRASEATRREAIRRAPAAEAGDHLPLLHLNLADTLRRQGRAQEALGEVERSRAALAVAPNPALQWLLDRVAGECYRALGERDAARDHLLASVQAARASGDAPSLGDALVNLATLYVDFEAAPRAVPVAQEALELARAQGDAQRERDALNLIGTARLRSGELEPAIADLRAALELDRRDQRLQLLPDDEAQLGAALSAAGHFAEARQLLRSALTRFVAVDRAPDRWVALLALGDSFERSDPDSAAHWYGRTMDVLDSGREVAGGLASGYLSTQRGVSLEGILHYFAQRHRESGDAKWLERAFAVAERSRGAGLRALIDQAAQEDDPRGTALLDSVFAHATDAEGRRAAAAAYAEHLSQRRAELGWSEQRVDLRALRQRLERGTLFLEYAVTDSASYVFASDRKRSELFELPARAQLAPLVRRLHDALRAPGQQDAELRALAVQLHAALLAPLGERLERIERLWIAPDDVLHELPFELLLAQDPGGELAALPWLGRSLPIAYAPSASLALREPQRPRRDGGVLAFGGPEFPAQPPQSSGSVPPLVELPSARAEVAGLARHFDAYQLRVYSGAAASESALRAAVSAQPPRVLHLATHGLIDARRPDLSCIALAPGADGADDGYLYTLEILGLRLRAELVVLSACESGRGRIERGEGVVGLTRSFLAGGAASVLCSLWSVADQSTAQLMEAFYADYARDRDAPRALRAARQALLARPETAHPFHWAAFVWVGGLDG